MALGVGMGFGGPTIGISVPLLDDDKKPTTIVHHHHYPLSEEQAGLYMKTKEYIDNLETRAVATFYYWDSNKNIKPMLVQDIRTRKIHKITMEQAEKLTDKYEEILKKQDKVTLMTKGIGGLSKPIFKKAASKAHLIATSIVWFPCLFPCSILLWYKLYKLGDEPRLKGPDGQTHRGYVIVDQNFLNLINISS